MEDLQEIERGKSAHFGFCDTKPDVSHIYVCLNSKKSTRNKPKMSGKHFNDGVFRTFGNENICRTGETEQIDLVEYHDVKIGSAGVSSIRTQKLAMPGTFDISEDEVLLHRSPGRRPSRRFQDISNNDNRIMFKRDLNRTSTTPLCSGDKFGGDAWLVEKNENVSDSFAENQTESSLHIVTDDYLPIQSEADEAESDEREAEDISGYYFNGPDGGIDYEDDFFGEFGKADDNATVRSFGSDDGYVKVRFPQYGEPLLADDLVLDLSCLEHKSHGSPPVPIFTFGHTSKSELKDQERLLSILNYEIDQLGLIFSGNRSLQSCWHGIVYKFLHCGQPTLEEIAERYPWTKILYDMEDPDLGDQHDNHVNHDNHENHDLEHFTSLSNEYIELTEY